MLQTVLYSRFLADWRISDWEIAHGGEVAPKALNRLVSELQPNEDFAPVKETDEPEGEAKSDDTNYQLAKALGDVRIEELFDIAASETEREFIKASNHFRNEINRDWVHTEPDEGPAPGLRAPDIDDLIKNAEQNGAIATCDEHVSGSPGTFYNRELKAPEPPNDHRCNTK